MDSCKKPSNCVSALVQVFFKSGETSFVGLVRILGQVRAMEGLIICSHEMLCPKSLYSPKTKLLLK